MKKHEAFQFLVKRRSANFERKVSRKEHYDKMLDKTFSIDNGNGETASAEIERLRISPPRVVLDHEQDQTDLNMSPATKRRGKTFILYMKVLIKGPNPSLNIQTKSLKFLKGTTRHP